MNLPYYNKLQTFVDNGEARLLFIDSPQRTISTLLQVAACELFDGTVGNVHEPWNVANKNYEGFDGFDGHYLDHSEFIGDATCPFDLGCKIICDRIDALKPESADGTVTLVVKELSKYLSGEAPPLPGGDTCEFELVTDVCDWIISNTREPASQAKSLLDRRTHYYHFGNDDLTEAQQAALKSGELFTDEVISQTIESNRKSWQAFALHLPIIEASETPHAIVDECLLKSFGLETAEHLLERLCMPTALAPRLLEGYTVAQGANFYDPQPWVEKDANGIITDQWTRSAVNSTALKGINPEKDTIPHLDMLPVPLREMLIEEVYPHYADYASHPQMITVASDQFHAKEIDGVPLPHINPVVAFANSTPTQRLDLYRAFPEHSEPFDALARNGLDVLGLDYNDPVACVLRKVATYDFLSMLDTQLKESPLNQYGVVGLTVEGGSAFYLSSDHTPTRMVHDIDLAVKGGKHLRDILQDDAQTRALRGDIRDVVESCFQEPCTFLDLPNAYLSPRGIKKVENQGTQNYLAVHHVTEGDIQRISQDARLTEEERDILKQHRGDCDVLMMIEVSDFVPTPLLNPVDPATKKAIDLESEPSMIGLMQANPIIDFTQKMLRAIRVSSPKTTDLVDIESFIDSGMVDLHDPMVRAMAVVHMAAHGFFPDALDLRYLTPDAEDMETLRADLEKRSSAHMGIDEARTQELLSRIRGAFQEVLDFDGHDIHLHPQEQIFLEKIQNGENGEHTADAALLFDSEPPEELAERIRHYPYIQAQIQQLQRANVLEGDSPHANDADVDASMTESIEEFLASQQRLRGLFGHKAAMVQPIFSRHVQTILEDGYIFPEELDYIREHISPPDSVTSLEALETLWLINDSTDPNRNAEEWPSFLAHRTADFMLADNAVTPEEIALLSALIERDDRFSTIETEILEILIERLPEERQKQQVRELHDHHRETADAWSMESLSEPVQDTFTQACWVVDMTHAMEPEPLARGRVV